MNATLDIRTMINTAVEEFAAATGRRPEEVRISPASYRRLIEVESADPDLGNLMIGCLALLKIQTSLGWMVLAIDEILADVSVGVI